MSNKSSNSHNSKNRQKLDIGYYRVLGIQKDKNGSANSSPASFSKYDKMPSPSFNPLSLFSGEKKEDRTTRMRLNYYKQLLQADIKLAKSAFINHESRFSALQVEYTEQKSQLTRWGLSSVMKDFRMQSWLRQSRGELLMNMTNHIIHTLESKLTDTTELLAFLNESKSKANRSTEQDLRQRVDNVSDSFYASPEVLLEKDRDFLKKRQRLSAIDKLCHSASATFKESLPKLNSRSILDRKHDVLSVVQRYASMLDSKNLCMKSDVAVKGSWEEFCAWYEQKSSTELQLYDEYLEFIDDEREREGRLFRRWCNLVKGSSDDVHNTQSGDESVSPRVAISSRSPTKSAEGNSDHVDQLSTNQINNESGNSNGIGGENVGTVEANAAYMIFPKCVQIFIRYFAINIIAKTYEIPQTHHGALLALTEAVIHRAVHESLFRYPNEELKRMDRAWRVHTLKCRHVSPLAYHTAPKYLGIKSADFDVNVETPKTSLEKHLYEISDGLPCSTPSTTSHNKFLDVLKEEDEHEESTKSSSGYATPPKSGMTETETPPSISSTSTMLTTTSELSLSPGLTPPQPPTSKPGGYTHTPPTTHPSKTNARSSSTSALYSSADNGLTKAKMQRSRSTSNSGLAALGGKTAYCETVLKNISVLLSLKGRMEFILANNLDKSTTSAAKVNSVGDDEIARPPPIMVDLRPVKFVSAVSNEKNETNNKRKMPQKEGDEKYLSSDASNVAVYALPARVMGLLPLAVSPRDAIVVILLAIQWLTRTASELSASAGKGGGEALGADDMFPLLVNVLSHANIPCIHLVMHYLQTYVAMESFGEAAYYVTSIGAAVEFIDQTYMVSSHDSAEDDLTSDNEGDFDEKTENEEDIINDFSNIEENKTKEKEVEEQAVTHLGEWLRDQQVMEDTMVVMMQEGWMG